MSNDAHGDAMPPSSGPDLVIAGAARCGTSYLAASLSAHPAIDGGAVKEPDFFSREYARGFAWYDGLYCPRRPGLLRLDASMSYTVPQDPDALDRLAEVAPEALIVYAVRDPLLRAVSHYRLLKQYLMRENEGTFGSAIRTNPVYLGASDYDRWLTALRARFPGNRVLVAPFDLTTRGDAVTTVIFGQLGLEPVHTETERVQAHRNEVVEFRSEALLQLRRLVRRSGAYPVIRRWVGPGRMRRLRSAATRRAEPLSVATALESCDPAQLQQIDEIVRRSNAAVTKALAEQDARLGLTWADVWQASLPPEESGVDDGITRGCS